MEYKDLIDHAGHQLDVWTRYDEAVGIDCLTCGGGPALVELENKPVRYRVTYTDVYHVYATSEGKAIDKAIELSMERPDGDWVAEEVE